MSSFFYGVLGMLFALLLFAGGVALGWRLHIKYIEKTAAAMRVELSEQEKRRQQEESRAFHQLTNYSPEMAYGIIRAADVYDNDNNGE